MTKARRQSRILEILRRKSIASQRSLADELAHDGVQVRQVTLSRDLRELGVVKTTEGYREPAVAQPTESTADRLTRILQQLVRRVDAAQNLVVIHTHPGGAAPVAVALDAQEWKEIVGTVAGDDTIFVATPAPRSALKVRKRLLEMC